MSLKETQDCVAEPLEEKNIMERTRFKTLGEKKKMEE